MATLVLGALGNAVFPGIGGIAGAFLGGLIDTYFIFPTLFPKPDIQGPKIADIQLQQASEGSDAKWILGPKNNVAGTIFWFPKKPDGKIDWKLRKNTVRVGKEQAVANQLASVDLAIAVSTTEALPGNRINRILQVWAGDKLIYDRATVDGKYESITFYYGDQTTKDPTMVAREGANNVPLYKKCCYVVIKGLELADHGNNIPNIRFVVEQDYDMQLSEALDHIMTRSGFDVSEYDTSRILPCFEGMAVNGPQNGVDSLAPLIAIYSLIVQDSGEKVVFRSRGDEEIVIVDENDLSTKDEGSSPSGTRKLELTDTNGYELPSEVVLSFISTDNDLQQATVRVPRTNFLTYNSLSMSVPVTLTPGNGKAAAKALLWAAEAERQKFTLNLPPRYLYLQEGDGIEVVIDGELRRLYAQEVNEGANGRIEVNGVAMTPQVYTQTCRERPGPPTVETSEPSPTFGVVYDGPPLTDSVADTFGVYYAAAAESPTANWPGGRLYSATSQAGSYAERGSLPNEAVIGTLRTVPRPNYGYGWDTESSVEVELNNGTLTGCSEQECLDGTNRMILFRPDGEMEIIGFRTVVSSGTNMFRLSNLLRGLRGTEPFQNTHSQGSKVLYLDGAVNFLDLGAAGLSSEDWYKLPAIGGTLSEYPATKVAVAGKTKRPFQPSHLTVYAGPDEDRSIQGTDLSLVFDAAPEYRIVSTIANRFANVSVGEYVQLGGAGNSGNNIEYLIIAKNDNQTLVVDPPMTIPDAPTSGAYSLSFGQVKDVVVTWERRSKKTTTFPSAGPLASDETPETYQVIFRRGGPAAPAARTVLVTQKKYVYRYQDQLDDGFTSSDHLLVEVRQVSTQVGPGIPASKDIYR